MSSNQGRQNFWKWMLLCGALLFLLLCAGGIFHGPLLSSFAQAYMVNENPEKADAIVILGGGLNFRVQEAVKLYQAEMAPRILVMQSELSATDRDELTLPECELILRALLRRGVSKDAITILGTNLTSSWEEGCVLKKWCESNQATRVIVPTGPFHTRRIKWLFEKLLNGIKVETRVVAIGENICSTWWQDERSLIDCQNEVIKYLVYRYKY